MAINISPPRWYNFIGRRLSRKWLSLSPPLEVATFTNEASAKTGSCAYVYTIGGEERREKGERERKGKRRKNRVSGSVKVNKGDPPCCPFVLARTTSWIFVGQWMDGIFDDRNFPSTRMGWMTLRTISVQCREECPLYYTWNVWRYKRLKQSLNGKENEEAVNEEVSFVPSFFVRAFDIVIRFFWRAVLPFVFLTLFSRVDGNDGGAGACDPCYSWLSLFNLTEAYSLSSWPVIQFFDRHLNWLFIVET